MERSIGTDKLKALIQVIDRAAQRAGVRDLRIIICGGLATFSKTCL